MLSFKPIIPEGSRHIAAIQDQQGNTKEVLFFSEVGRNAPKLPDNTFAEDLKKYTEAGSTPQDFRLKPEFKMSILPSNKINGFQRETVSVFGKSGSGKSWQIKEFVQNWLLLNPGKNVYMYSMNRLENDPTYDNIRESITQIDLMSVDCAILPENYEDSLFIFDDVLDVIVSISPPEMFGEQYHTADLTARSRMERECKKKAQSIRGFLNDSVKNILNLGRKYGCSCLTVYHKMRSGIDSSFAVQESTSCILFPYTATKSTLHGFLQERLSFSKGDIQEFSKEVFFPYEFVCINNAGKLFFFTPNHFKMLS